MTAVNRITPATGTKVKKESKQLASCTSASSPLKGLVPVSTPMCMKGPFAKSPSTSSSVSGKRGLHGGNAISNRKALTKSSRVYYPCLILFGLSNVLECPTADLTKYLNQDRYVIPPYYRLVNSCRMFVQKSQGTKDAMVDAKVSTSECSTEATSTEFEASNELSLKYIEPDETKCIITATEPDPSLQYKDLDVLHSNLAFNWFSLGDHEFDDFLKTNTDQSPDMTGSEKPISLSCGNAVESPDSIPDGTNNSHNDDFQGADCSLEYITTTSTRDKQSEEGNIVEEELRIKTPDVQECIKRKNNFHNYEDGQALSEMSEGTSDKNAQQDTKHAKASRILLRLEGYVIDALRGRPCYKILLSSLFVLLTIWFSVGNLIEDEMVPPPT